jgi:hypothetical protein
VVSTLVHVGWCLLHCMRRDSGARSHAARNARCIGCVGFSRIPAWCAWYVARRMLSSMGEADGRLRQACGALHSCAGWRRRCDRHGQGRRAVRRRGDIRHRSTSARGRAAMGVEADARGRRRGRFRTEAVAGAARLRAGWRRGLDERRGSHVQGRLDHQHQGGTHCA